MIQTGCGYIGLEHLVIRSLEFVWDLGFGAWNFTTDGFTNSLYTRTDTGLD